MFSVCRTPNNENGNCIDLKLCPKLRILLERRKQIASAVDFLQKSFCGYEGINPKICCPFENLSLTTPKNKKVIDSPLDMQLGFSSIQSSQETCGKTDTTQFKIVGGTEAHLGEYLMLLPTSNT